MRIPEAWRGVFASVLEDAESVARNSFNEDTSILPAVDRVFRCFSFFPPEDTRVVIVGQDPYHTPGVPTGLAFERDTEHPGRAPPSLVNVFKAVRHTYPDATCDIESWARQGVLMLNRSLTVEAHKPNSHAKRWRPITDAMVRLLSAYARERNQRVVFMLWGNNAKELVSLIDTDFHLVLTHTHPSPLSRKPFVGCDHFRRCNEEMIEDGHIQW